jgi:hypothetical protein
MLCRSGLLAVAQRPLRHSMIARDDMAATYGSANHDGSVQQLSDVQT